MKKFVYYPLWEIEALERYMENMESKGYRLIGCKYLYWFYFSKSKQKTVNYFFTYMWIRGLTMHEFDRALLTEHSANPIKVTCGNYGIYRITQDKTSL